MSKSRKIGRNNRHRSSVRRSSRRRRFKVFRLSQLFRRINLFPGLFARAKSDRAKLFPELWGKLDVVSQRLFRKLEQRGRTTRRDARKFRANSQQVNVINYENLEARQLLAADILSISVDSGSSNTDFVTNVSNFAIEGETTLTGGTFISICLLYTSPSPRDRG